MSHFDDGNRQNKADFNAKGQSMPMEHHMSINGC